MAEPDFDWLVIGSGFGGSVAALRLAEKVYRVGVLECGRRYEDSDFARSAWNLRRYFWAPRLGLRGIFRLTLFKDVFIASGNGVGGGSLGYANTLYRARPAFFTDSQWDGLDDWEAELGPHYDTAERMLGVADYEGMTPADGKHSGGLPRISDRLGEVVRTNTESVQAVTVRDDDRDFTRSVAITSSI